MVEKIFITGGAGYVGSSLALFLLKKEYSVTIYDKFFFRNPFINNNRLNLIKGDIRDLNKLRSSIKGHDYVINLACISNDQSYIKNQKIGKDINLHAFKTLLDVAKKSGIKKFLNTSSASVYGISNNINDEKSKPLPISMYSKINLINEKKLVKHASNNFIATNIRPGSIYGLSPRMRFDLVINNYIASALFKKQIKIFGGFQIRPFVNIEDLNRFFFRILKSENHLINKETFNICIDNHKLEFISGLIRSLVEDVLKINVEIKYYGTNDIRSYYMKSKKIYDIFNFKYKNTIEDSAINMINYLNKRGKINFNNKIYINEKNKFI